GRLQSDEESPGWFDVEVGIDYNGTRIDLIPLLQQALAYLGIENNSDDALPETLWLHNGDALIRVASDRIRPLARTLLSLLGKEHNGKLILPTLDAAEVRGDVEASWETSAELRNLSEKLTSFQALSSVPVPGEVQTQLRYYQQEGLNWLMFLREFGLGG